MLDELTRRKLSYQHRVHIGDLEVDFLVGRRTIVEVDGYYHALKKKVSNDASKEEQLESLGYVVLRITGAEAKNRRLLRDFGAKVQEHYERELIQDKRSKEMALTHGIPVEGLKELKGKLEEEARKKQEKQKKQKIGRSKELTDEELFLQAVAKLSRNKH